MISREVKHPGTVLAYAFIDVIFTVRRVKYIAPNTSSCLASTRNMLHFKIKICKFRTERT
jgi:hypothetical protein